MDTLVHSNRLVEAGFTRKQAEVQTQLLKEVIMSDLAKQADVTCGFRDMNSSFKEVQNQFREVNAQFKEIDNRFKEIDNRFKEVDNRFDQVQIQIEGLSLQIKELAVLIKDRPALDFINVIKMLGLLMGFLFAVSAALPYLIRVFNFFSKL